MAPVDDTSLARRCAEQIRDAFEDYNNRFRDITKRARRCFETRDWESGRADAVERIDLYDVCADASRDVIEALLAHRARDRTLWTRIHREFAPLVANHPDVEFTKTYFNSITRRLFNTVGVDEVEFLGDAAVPLRNARGPLVGRNYANTGSLRDVFRAVLADSSWSVPYADIEVSANRIAREVVAHFAEHQDGDMVLCVDVLAPVFYRARRAYLVAKVTGWTRKTPLVIALENGDDGIGVDGVIQIQREVAALFGYARSYFHADFAAVGTAVLFLKRLLPGKQVHELFTILGRAKQGKTERYRDFARHLDHSNDQFIFAPGKRGMVMLVFTLPSYDIVFKIIRDKFPPPKDTTRRDVMSRYDLVFKHDKAGRLVDTQEFRKLELPRHRFSPALLEEMLKETGDSVRLEGDDVVIDHVYLERRMRPLDLYLREVGHAARVSAVLDYGQALRDLAANNIFPGDLLLKNFGVSQDGRVIFYDYDELCLLTDCNFRKIPAAKTHDDEFSAEPWFYVAENDVFPEEFPAFLGIRDLMERFAKAHAELFTAEYWVGIQDRIRTGEVLEVLPY